MDLKKAKERMKTKRAIIKTLKSRRMEVTNLINGVEKEIREIKGAIFRGEIK